MKVYKDDVLQATGYSVAVNRDQAASPGGSVTFVAAPATSVVVLVERSTPMTQEVNYTVYDKFPAETHERALDKLTVQIQDTARDAAAMQRRRDRRGGAAGGCGGGVRRPATPLSRTPSTRYQEASAT